MNKDLPRIQPLTPDRSRELAADPDRRRLLDQILHATTRDEIGAARAAQRAWLVANPDDFGMLEAGEDLAYAEEALMTPLPSGSSSEVSSVNPPTLAIELEREADGRWIAEVPGLPGVMAYGQTHDEALIRAQAIALRTLADRLERGEPVPEVSALFHAA